jgi:hypothetical protein
MRNLLDVAVNTGDRRATQTLVDRVAPWLGQVIVPAAVIVDGAIARPLARGATLLGDYDRAEEWIGVAHEIHVRLQAPFFIALGQLDHADRATNRLSGL